MCGRYVWSLSLVAGIVLLSDVVAADFSDHNSSDVDSRDQRVRMLSSSALIYLHAIIVEHFLARY